MTALKSIIEDKDTELSRNKNYVDKVKEQFVMKQNQDLEEIRRLNEIIFKLNL